MSIETLIVEFCVTDFCNLGCKYCYVKRRKKFMDIAKINEYIKTIHRQVLKVGAKKYSINYFGGEPLLAFELIKEAYQIFKRDPLCEFQTMTTNGTLLTDEIYHWIKNHEIGFGWSFDGLNSCKSRPLLKNLDCNKPFKNTVDMLLPKAERLLQLANRSVHYVISPYNVKDIVQDYDYLKSLGVTTIGFSLCRDNVWTPESVLDFQKNIREIRILNENDFKAGNIVDVTIFAQMIVDFCLGLNGCTALESPCFAGCTGCAITPEGKVYPCQRFATNNVLEMKDWDYAKFRGTLKSSCYKDCETCDIRLFCKGAACLFEQIKNDFKQIHNFCQIKRIIVSETIEMIHNLKNCETFQFYLKQILNDISRRVCHFENIQTTKSKQISRK